MPIIDFSYKIKEDDDSIPLFRHKEAFFGYEKVKPTTFSKKLNDLREEIINDDEIINDFEYSSQGRNLRYVRASKKIWNELGIELQKVQFLRPDYPFDENKFQGYITKEFVESLVFDYPTKIKILRTDVFRKSGFNALYLEFKDHNSVVFRDIILPKVEMKLNSSIYAHEITHIEQENAGGGVTKYTNIETLPIFIELLFSLKTDESGLTTDKIIRHRLAYLSGAIKEILNNKEMDFETRMKLEKYIISIIQSINLFNRYMDGSEEVKKEFIKGVNEIFVGKKVIEQMLTLYDSNFKEIEPNLKVLRRK